MVRCSACGRENPKHFKFCLGCGAALPPPGADERTTAKAHRGAEPLAEGERLSQRVAPSKDALPCPQCGSFNEPSHRFCATCGHNLADGRPSPHMGTGPRLVALNPDGTEGAAIPLQGTTTVGRAVGGIFAQDLFLSPRHASFTPQGGVVIVSDERSLNGIYRRLPPDQRFPLSPGQMFRLGQELVLFETLTPQPADDEGVEAMGAPLEGYVGKIGMVLGRSTIGTAFPIPETGLNLGRERGEVIFAEDGYVSGMHCRLSYENGQVFLTDLGSSNGTYVRIKNAEPFKNGEVLLMGQQLFRIAC